MHTKLENLKGEDHKEDLRLDGRIISEYILGKQGGKAWTRFIWLFHIGTDGRLL